MLSEFDIILIKAARKMLWHYIQICHQTGPNKLISMGGMEDVIEKYERQKEPSTHIVLNNSQVKLYFWKIIYLR